MMELDDLTEYQAVVWFIEDGMGAPRFYLWFDVGAVGGGVLREYLEAGGHILMIGSEFIRYVYNQIPPMPGDFEYDWFGIGSTGYAL